jgi:ABC-type Fe3+/spermidine/putrescine transport system ATPase subunit
VGISFLYVTHDQEEALTLSDRIAVMNHGRILQEGTAEEIYERPSSRFVADFIGQTNFFEGEVQAVDGDTVVRDDAGRILRCAPASWVRPGMWVAVAIRPEHVVPANGSGPGNRLTGTLARRTYLGDLVQYHVRLPDGHEVVCQRQSDDAGPTSSWEVGAEVELGWDPARALVVRDEEVAEEEDLRLLAEEDEITEERAGA